MIGRHHEECVECKGEIVTVGDECVCTQCGLVVETKAHPSKELGSGVPEAPDLSLAPYSAPGERANLVDGLGSFIDYQHTSYFHDSRGKPLPPNEQRRFSRLKTIYDRRAKVSGYETDYRTLGILQKIIEALNLPTSVHDRAAYLYRKGSRLGAGEKCSTSVVFMAYCLVLALKELDDRNRLDVAALVQAFRRAGHRVSIQSLIRANLDCRPLLQIKPQIRRSEEYLPRILQRAITSRDIHIRLVRSRRDPASYQKRILDIGSKILENISVVERAGRSPYVFAASTIYVADQVASTEDRAPPAMTQKQISRVAGVAEYSVRDQAGFIKNTLKRREAKLVSFTV
jgi:transcription initiation factor TFIIIB Brf1 subunit/transcription initiation factor TFIIB